MNNPQLDLTVVVWNTEWASPGPRSERGRVIRRELLSVDPDVICLTEASPGLLPDHGHVIVPDESAWYTRGEGAQKVLLWSRWPWQHRTGTLPGAVKGRFVEGLTGPDERLIRFTGVCIPWAASRVGRKDLDRTRWEDHLEFIEALASRQIQGPTEIPEVVLGDFNQRIPKGRQRTDAYKALMAYLDGWNVPTAGWEDPSEALIDHVALRRGVTGSVEHIWPTHLEDVRLSDHVGLKLGVEVDS